MIKRVIFFVLFLIPALCFSRLSRTYPKSPITTIRFSVYQDCFNTIWNSTDVYQLNQWDMLGDTYTWTYSNQIINSYWTVTIGTIPTVVPITMDLKTYTDLISEQATLRDINAIIDDGIDQYMVWPATYAPPGWIGWCSTVSHGIITPVECP